MITGAYTTGKYRNVFSELGISEEIVSRRLQQIFQTMFYGAQEERIYHPVGIDMGYMEDTGNLDVRTEGMSYGMMMCIQTNHKEEFDRLWKWVKTYMWLTDGPNAGFYAWSCGRDGTKNAYGPAPDGEEYFAMALLFASNRWGDGEGIFEYSREAKDLLHHCIHNGEYLWSCGKPMWNRKNHLIKFICEAEFTNPSYHLPHFYELFGRMAYEEDQDFFLDAAKASREYLKKACHKVTGLSAEYADYDGTPHHGEQKHFGGRHDWYYSDAYRTILNLSLDYEWFGTEKEWEREVANHLQVFFSETVKDQPDHIYEIDGTVLADKALHPVAIIATNAVASLASDNKYAAECVQKLWDTPLRKGERRYYDNCLYFFCMLALSGQYRIYGEVTK